jgi:hypothetical protein
LTWSPKEAGVQQSGAFYRIRHINTGRIIVLQQINHNKQLISTLGLEGHVDVHDSAKCENLRNKSLFRLTSTTVDIDNKIRTGTCVKIQHVESGFFLSTKAENTYVKQVEEKKAASMDVGQSLPS